MNRQTDLYPVRIGKHNVRIIMPAPLCQIRVKFAVKLKK